VYNVSRIKKIFAKTLTSVEKQSYGDLEIIVVNDGSTDDTVWILEELKKGDSRIRVITKENGGVESARRRGIAEAKGEYLFHIDQDDLIAKDAIEILYNAAIDYNADVTIGQSKHFYKIVPKRRIAKSAEDFIIDHTTFMNQYYHGFFGRSIFPVQIWNKLYKKTFLDSLPEPPRVGMYHEDLNYNLHILPMAEKIVWLSNLTYYYRWGGLYNKTN